MQTLRLCQKAGLVKLGNVAIDGPLFSGTGTEFPPMSSVKKLLRNFMRNLVRLNLYGFIAALL